MPETTSSLAPAGAWLITYLVHSTLLLGGAWVAGRLLGRHPHVREGLWKTALLGALVTASAQLAFGGSPLGGRLDLSSSAPAAAAPAAPEAKPAAVPAEAQGEPAAPAEIDLATLLAALEADRRSPGASGGAAEQGPAASTPAERAAEASPGLASGVPWGAIAAGAILALSALFLAAFAAGWWRLKRRLGGRREITSGPALSMLSDLARRAGVRRRIRLTASDAVPIPIAFGVVCREICVPERALRELSPAALESMLAHELAHLVRRDPEWRLATGALKSALFFQPLNWIAVRRLEACSEELCDDWAVEKTEQPLALARCLTDVAGWFTRPALGAAVPAMAAQRSQLGRRVRRLVDPRRRAPGTSRARWLPAFGAALLVIVFAAAPGASASGGGGEEGGGWLPPIPNAAPSPAPPTSKAPPAPEDRGGPAAPAPPAGAADAEGSERGEAPEPPEPPEPPEADDAIRWLELGQRFAPGGSGGEGDEGFDIVIDVIGGDSDGEVIVDLEGLEGLGGLGGALDLEALEDLIEEKVEKELGEDFQFDLSVDGDGHVRGELRGDMLRGLDAWGRFDDEGFAWGGSGDWDDFESWSFGGGGGRSAPPNAGRMREHAEKMRRHAEKMRELGRRMRERGRDMDAEEMREHARRMRELGRRMRKLGKKMRRRGRSHRERAQKMRQRAMKRARRMRERAMKRAERMRKRMEREAEADREEMERQADRGRALERALREARRRHREELRRIIEEHQ